MFDFSRRSLLMGPQALLNYTLSRIEHSVPFVVHVSCPALYVVSCRTSTVGLGVLLFLSALFLGGAPLLTIDELSI